MDLQAKITLDNSGLVAGLQQSLAPLQQAIAGLQQMAAAIQRLVPANAAAAAQVSRETAAIQANTAAVAQNSAAKATNARAPVGGIAQGRRAIFPMGTRMLLGAGIGMAADAASSAMEGAGMARGAAGARVAGDVGNMALMGSIAGPWSAAAGAVLGLVRGVYREWTGFAEKSTQHAETLRRSLAEARVAERSGNRAIMREDSGDALQSRIDSLHEAQLVLRERMSAGLVDPKDLDLMQAQEASLVRQIALAKERMPLVRSAETRKENAETLAAMRGREARSDISDMALPAVVEMLRSLETRMSAKGYMDTDPSAVRRDAADAASLRARRDNLQQATVKDALQWLGKINSSGLSMGANEYTRRGVGTGTSVGPALSGVERNTSMANQLLTRIANSLSSRPAAPVGVFA